MNYSRIEKFLDDYRMAAYFFGGLFLILAVVPSGKAFDKIGNFDKFAHFIGFYFFTFFMIMAYGRKLKTRLLILMVALAFGGSIEIIQSFLPWRSQDFSDFLWDGVGAVSAFLTPSFLYHYILEAIATVGYIGFVPIAPGTITAAITLTVYYAMPVDWRFLNFAVPAIAVLGIWASHYVAKKRGIDDPNFVVVDEAVGALISVMFLPKTIPVLVIGFLAFRFFDILKPLGIHRTQNLPGGLGIVVDDMLAGAYALLVTFALTAISRWL